MSPLAAQLLDAAGALPPERFAVVDGAYYADLPAALRERGLAARPLYVGGSDAEDARAGPHLVQVPTYDAARAVIEIVGDHSTGVFWSAPAGGEALFRHLRSINAVRIATVDEPAGEEDHRTVLFRHGDPVALGCMIAVMTPEQKARLLGPGAGIAYGGRRWGQVDVLRAGG